MRPVELSKGTVLGGDFRILGPLTEGGMGAVYVAEQIGTGNLRAVKIMHRELVEDAGLRRRFEQEARIGARIRSDHVVHVVAAGVDGPTGVPFLAMELLEGEDLAHAAAARGVFPVHDVWEILAQICHALGAAHEIGVVHRDLKPENVFLVHGRREGAAFTVKVLDFGIAKVAADARLGTTQAVGTPMWMAPEQTETGATITPAADVWALGLLAFRLLTGKRYWRGANVPEPSAAALLRELVLEPLVPASARAADLGVEGRLPEGFDGWFARCVARDPGARFRDATEARRALAPVLGGTEGRVVHTPPPRGAADEVATAATVQFSTPAIRPVTAELDDDDTAAGVPQRRVSAFPFVGAALVVAVAGGGVWATLGGNTNTPAPPATPAMAPAGLRCPPGMVQVPGGSATVRGEAVAVETFCLDATEVTVASYAACAAGGKRRPSGDTVDWPGIADADRRTWGVHCNGARADRQTHPMNCVSAHEAATFCKEQHKRLPSEPEWQWASQGGPDQRLYPWGTVAPDAQLCWSGTTNRTAAGAGSCPVGSFPGGATPTGLKDMAGNVWEWTLTEFSPQTREFVIRGGGWSDAAGEVMRTHHRDKRFPIGKSSVVGFRCAWPPLP